jgi:signal transduction histidine kinase
MMSGMRRVLRGRRVEAVAAALVLAASTLAVTAGNRAAVAAERDAAFRSLAAWEARLRAEATAGAALFASAVGSRATIVAGAPARVVRIRWNAPASSAGDGDGIRSARAAEFSRGDPGSAAKAYERLASAGAPEERVAAARERGRILRERGDGEAARRAVLPALEFAAQAGSEGLLLRVEAVRCGVEADASTLAADIRAGAFASVPPSERASALLAAGDSTTARPFADAAVVADALAGDAALLAGARLGWPVAADEGEFAFAEIPVVTLAAALIPAVADGQAVPAATGGVGAPPPLLGLHLRPSPAAEATAAADAGRAGRAVRVPALGVAALLCLGCGILLIQARASRLHAERREAFVCALTHELKTPVANVLLHAETLATHAASDPAAIPRFAPVLTSEARRLDRRIRQLLGLLSGAVVPRVPGDPFPVAAEIRAAIADAAAGASARGVAVVPPTGDAVSSAPGGAPLFRRALEPVLENALAHARVEVRVSLEAAGDFVRVVVEDDGDGIPRGDRARAFEPFVRLAPARTGLPAGTGLGLAIARRCATEAGGDARVEDPTTGRGARIVLEWPGGESADDPAR